MSSHPPPSPSSLQHQHQDLAPSSPFSNSQFGDTTLTKVFVGGLAWETQRDSVRRYFEQFGEILEAVVITDKATGRSKGYGFVTFRDPEGARRACADPTPVIDGRRANCNLASLGVRSRPGTPQQGGRFRGGSPAAGRSPGRAQAFNGAAAGSPQHLPYSYQQAFPYAPYGYVPYQQEYLYPPNMVYNGPFYVTPPFPPPLYGGGGPPPPTLGSPTAGLYPYQAFQVPYPYAASGAHMPLQNQPPPSGLTPDQSPPTNVVAGTGPQFGLPQQHFPGPGAASQHGQQSSD